MVAMVHFSANVPSVVGNSRSFSVGAWWKDLFAGKSAILKMEQTDNEIESLYGNSGDFDVQ